MVKICYEQSLFITYQYAIYTITQHISIFVTIKEEQPKSIVMGKEYYRFIKEILALDIELSKSIAADNDGNIFVCDHKQACLLVIDKKSGKLIRKLGENKFQVPTDIAIHDNGSYFIVTDRCTQRF
jgi:DNA-binding beta-propeller fold protein YncE